MRFYRKLGPLFVLLSLLYPSASLAEDAVDRGALVSQHFDCIAPYLDAVAEFPAEGKLFPRVQSRVTKLRDTVVTSRTSGKTKPYLKHAKEFDRDVLRKLRYAGLRGINVDTRPLRAVKNCYVALKVVANKAEFEERVREVDRRMAEGWQWGLKDRAVIALSDTLTTLTQFEAKTGVSKQDYLDRGMDINRLSAPIAVAQCISASLNPQSHYFQLINDGLIKLNESIERPLAKEYVQRNADLLPLVLNALITRPPGRDLKVEAGNPIFENRAWLYANSKKAIPEVNESINISRQLISVIYAEFGHEYDSSIESFSDAKSFESVSCIGDAIFDTKNGFYQPFHRREYGGLDAFLREQRAGFVD